MRTKMIQIVVLLLITATQVTTIFTAEALVEYKNASVTPIFWEKDDTALVLLGKEKRKKAGTVWCDFFGRKDKKDGGDPLVTAKREALEESAGQLNLLEDPLYRYQGTKNTSTVHFIWKVGYVDPQDIHSHAAQLREIGKGDHVEKTDWRWVKLEQLLNQETGLVLHWSLKDKLKHRTMGKIFRSLLKKEPKTEEKEEEKEK